MNLRNKVPFFMNYCSGYLAKIFGTDAITLPKAKANGLKSLTLFGGTEQSGTPTPDTPQDIVSNNGVLKARHQSGLPLGYTLLEYVIANGDQYIDTGLKSTLDTILETELAISGTTNQMLWANASISGEQITCYLNTSSGNNRFGDQVVSASIRNYLTLNTFSTIKQDKTGIYIDGTNRAVFNATTEFTSTNNMYFLWANGTGADKVSGKTKGLVITQGGHTYTFLPCIRKSDSVVGFYCKENNTFCENQGTGNFTAGNPVSDAVEIYTDGTVETIEVTGKNLLDMATENIVLGKYISNSGSDIADSRNFYNSKYIQVVPSGTYTWSTSSSIRYFSVMEYNSDYVFKKRTLFGTSNLIAGTSGTITLGSDTAFVLVGSNMDGSEVTLNNITAVNWQFELGSTATEYEPYYNDGTATAEMLLKVSDYKDTQEVIAGTVTRRVGIKVFDGTETWYSMGANVGCGIKLGDNSISTDTWMLCSHFSYAGVNKGVGILTPNTFSSNTSGYTYFVASNTTDVNTFKQWLADQYNAGTPVILVYPLETSTAETVTGQHLTTQAGTNTISITQASLSNLELEAVYKRSK